MFETLRELFGSLKEWRAQVLHLALIDLRKQAHGAALGWFWVFFKPFMYVFCFWFALYIGIKATRVSGMDGIQYICWLTGGIFPWFFLQSTLTGGSNIFRKYAYLVKKMKFPVVLIPVFHQLSLLFLHLMLLAFLIVICIVSGFGVDIYWVQLPFVVVLLYAFSLGFSLLTAPLSAISRDVTNLISALSTPIFWLSGVIFNLDNVKSHAVHMVANFNPVTFFVTAYRNILVGPTMPGVEKTWLWNNPMSFWIGIGVIVVTIVAGLIMYNRLHKDMADVL